jgi:hypothetical protein
MEVAADGRTHRSQTLSEKYGIPPTGEEQVDLNKLLY